jgi:hypothetical protein
MTDEWVPFAEGEYLVEKAWVVAPDARAIPLEGAVVEVLLDPRGRRRLNGSGLVRNALLVELLEEEDTLDLLLDFGGAFQFRLHQPHISGGKVFAPAVKSTLQFTLSSPLEALAPDVWRQTVTGLKVLNP